MNQYTSPFILQIFGATGHLARTRIFHGLLELFSLDLLPESFMILGYGRTEHSTESFRTFLTDHIGTHDTALDFLSHVYYVQGSYDTREDFVHATHLLQATNIQGPRLCYFAVPPQLFSSIGTHLAATKRTPDEDIRLIIEKPFGTGSQHAQEIYSTLTSVFPEDRLYLLDHYLGKSAVQGMMHLRLNNPLLDAIIQPERIANIQITAHESEGILNRGGYFDHAGTLEDWIQSHMMLLLGLTIMPIPGHHSPESIARERMHTISSVLLASTDTPVISGQYESYHTEEHVDPTSSTETYVAAELELDHEAWRGIPIYIRMGKKLEQKETTVVIELKPFAFQDQGHCPNRLIFRIQPDASLQIELHRQHNSFDTTCSPEITSLPLGCIGPVCTTEHATLLLKALEQDHTYFLSFKEIYANWILTEAIQQAMPMKPISYTDGTMGPDKALALPTTRGFQWFAASDT